MAFAIPKPTVRIIHHLARAGGTLISRCLGSMQHVMLLSEIHPMGVDLYSPTHNPLAQAQRWFGLFTDNDIAIFQKIPTMNFATAIELIARKCNERNRVLVLRDWTHLDFTAVPFYSVPCYRLTTAEALCERFTVIQTTTVRHPIDQWLSLSKLLAVIKGQLSLENFLHGYRLFAEHCARIGFVRYEDFVNAPEAKTRELCERLNMQYDGGFLARWSSYNNITGETGSMSRAHTEIKALSRQAIDSELLEQFERNPDYQASLVLLGYTHP